MLYNSIRHETFIFNFVLFNIWLSPYLAAQIAPDILWQKCYGGSSSDQGFSVDQTPDGGFIVSGATSSNDGDVSGNHGVG